MLAALIIGLAVFGLVIGSFLNVVIYRVPQRLSLIAPGSFCPSCGASLLARENVPLLSFVVQRGKCRHCQVRISLRYPFVELLTAALFAGTAARLRLHWDLPAYIVLAAGLVALGFIDLDRRVLPRQIIFFTGSVTGVLLLIASGASDDWTRIGVGFASSFVWFTLFYSVHRIDRRLLGLGDVRLAPLLGFALGWLGVGYSVAGFVLASVIGAAFGMVLLVTGRATKKTAVPFGPFLVAGCEIAVLVGAVLLKPLHGA